MKKLTETQAKTFGEWGYLALEKHFTKMVKHESGVLKDKDPEELHQMRVGSRRLRSAMAGFAPALSLAKTLQDKTIGKISRILGSLRDIDVLLDILENKYKPSLPKSEQKQLDKALKKLHERRHDAFNQVKTLLKEELYPEFKEKFSQWLDEPTYQELAALPMGYILPDLLLPEISKFLIHPAWLAGVTITENKFTFLDASQTNEAQKLIDYQAEKLHDLRKEAKRGRYQMELFTQFYPESYQEYLQDIKLLQEVLGDLQDAHVLGEFLSEIFHEDLSEAAPNLNTQLAETIDQRFHDWQKLQQKFLDVEYRQGFKQAIQRPNL